MNNARDGDLYKTIKAFGKTFEIRYGYYEDFEREKGDPIPIYPNFIKSPEYTEDGRPLATAMQDICKFARLREYGFGFCNDCEFYEGCEDFIGVCLCEQNRKNE